ncbi:MAG: large-conductance mechanosensitive channel protein MscL [Bacteroidota bacterium]
MIMMKEFREFILRGNVLDLAVAVVIGAAFGAIITSFVNDILMPPIGVMLGGVDFADLAITLQEAVGEDPAVTLNYGKFIQTIIDFLLVALGIFLVVKAYNSTQKKEEEAPAAPPEPSNEEKLLAEIRDLLKNN